MYVDDLILITESTQSMDETSSQKVLQDEGHGVAVLYPGHLCC